MANPLDRLEEFGGHSKIFLPDTDMGGWFCVNCYRHGEAMGQSPQDVPCEPRERPDDWPFYG